jgi:hypothetical protein
MGHDHSEAGVEIGGQARHGEGRGAGTAVTQHLLYTCRAHGLQAQAQAVLDGILCVLRWLLSILE